MPGAIRFFQRIAGTEALLFPFDLQVTDDGKVI
jgi:hypothetical protein